MKVAVLATFLLLGYVSISAALPATINDEVEILRPKSSVYGDQPIIDTGVIGDDEGPFYSNPFGGLFENLEGMMRRMREQMESVFKSSPGLRSDNSSDEAFVFPSLGGGFPSLGGGFPSLGDIDLGKGNTTSVTKVIDGHKVVINETEYKKEDDFGGAFFKVRIIDVKPDGEGTTTEKDAEEITPESTVPKDTEAVENSAENEIPKSREEGTASVPEKLRAV